MNFIKLKSQLRRQEYAYFDLPKYYADNLLRQRKLKVKIICEMEKEDAPYNVIFCRVPKKETSSFEVAMGELEKKMLVCGHTDYPDFCSEFIKNYKLN
ncbi:MAG: hypothetical protein K6F88_03945 [Ruminococcus sp.]|nr:hypothetical protein [Ruminococcus sp.]